MCSQPAQLDEETVRVGVLLLDLAPVVCPIAVLSSIGPTYRGRNQSRTTGSLKSWPAGASRGPPPPDWWPTQTNRQGDGGPLGPARHRARRSPDQPTRMSALLTKRCIEGQWKNTWKHFFEREKASVRRDSQCSTYCQRDVHSGLSQRPGSQTVTSFFIPMWWLLRLNQ